MKCISKKERLRRNQTGRSMASANLLGTRIREWPEINALA